MSDNVVYREPDWLYRKPSERKEDEYWVRLELINGDGNPIGEVGDFSSLDVVWNSLADDLEASSFSIPGTSPWAKLVMQANVRIILARIEIFRQNKLIKLWTGRVDRSVRTKNGPEIEINVELISDKAWLKYINAWSAPFAPLGFQAPKREQKYGKAISMMKHYLMDNLIRIQSGFNELGMLNESNRLKNPNNWSNVQSYMWPVMMTPYNEPEDTSPTVALEARMTPISELVAGVCKDYNLLVKVEYLIPGRDEIPAGANMTRPGIVIDFEDKDLDRSRSTPGSWLSSLAEDAIVFVRGIFGRYDVPAEPEMATLEGRREYFGTRPGDPWVIFRDSEKHWSEMEFASYAPTASRSISGGKSPEFLNKGISLVANGLIGVALASVGLGFLSGLANLVTGTINDVLLAYQDADDKNMRKAFGPYTFFEESVGSGTNAYSFEAIQHLRQSRWGSIGYDTATFYGGVSAFKPFRIFEDFDVLDQVGWEDSAQERIIAERVKEIQMSYTRSEGAQFEVRLGESDRPEDPWTIQQRRNEMFAQAINTALTLE